MKLKSLLFGTLIVGAFSLAVVGCKSGDSTQTQLGNNTVTNLSKDTSLSSIDQAVSGDALKALRAGVGCVDDQDHTVIDPDLRANDAVSQEVKYGRIGDVLTKTLAFTYQNQNDGKLHVQEKLTSVVSDNKGELLDAPIESTRTCDVQLPLDKACMTDVVEMPTPPPTTQLKIQVNGENIKASQSNIPTTVQKKKKDNVCQILQVEKLESGNFSGSLTLKNGLVVKALKHTVTTSGVITCGGLKYGKGRITEETVLSRDVVAVSGLVACGGAPVLQSRTVVLGDGQKVVQSQHAEILSAPKR